MSENTNKLKTNSLNCLGSIKRGEQINRDTLIDCGKYPVWNGGVKPSGYTDKYNMLAKTITISEGGSCGFVNFCKENFWLGRHCYAIEKLDASLAPDFLFFCLKSHERRIMRLRAGSGLPHIQKKDIEKLQIQFPPIEEQKRISGQLTQLDKIIVLRKQRGEKLKHIKQAYLFELFC